MKYLAALLIVLLLASVPACSQQETFGNEQAAAAALLGKSAHQVMVKLGAQDSVSSGGTFPDGRRYTECWKYNRAVRDNSGDLTTLNLFFFKGKVVRVAADKG